MRTRIGAIVLAAVAAAVAAAAPAACPAKPTLRLSAPLVLRGQHFRANEAVVVTFTGRDLHVTRRVRTTKAGVFTARVPPRGKCLGRLVVAAKGASGDAARLVLPGRTCGPALGPKP